MRRMFGIVAVITAVAAVACGGDSDEKSDASTTTVAPVTTAPATFTGDADSRFCQIGADFAQRYRNIGAALSSGPDAAQTELTGLKTAIDDARDSAPAAIKSEVQVLAEAFGRFYGEVQAANFQPGAIAGAGSKLSSPEVLNAIGRLEQYGQQVCGIQPG